jgi:transcriptional regulatory protein GAL4
MCRSCARYDYINLRVLVTRDDTIGRVVCHVSTEAPSKLYVSLTTNLTFHATLIITLCAVSFPQATAINEWLEDISMARNTFRRNLGEDSLSARCVAILDQIVSDDRNNTNIFGNIQLNEGNLNTFPWSAETNELFSAFDWDLSSNTFQ